MALNSHRHTVYDVMDAKGVFAANKANVGARDEQGNSTYEGPVEFPKMFYHPEGEERVTRPPEIIATPMGPKEVGEKREIITAMAKTPEDEVRLRDEGWHDHPSKALAAAGKPVPMISSDQRIKELERQAKQLQDQLDLARSTQVIDKTRKGTKTGTGTGTGAVAGV